MNGPGEARRGAGASRGALGTGGLTAALTGTDSLGTFATDRGATALTRRLAPATDSWPMSTLARRLARCPLAARQVTGRAPRRWRVNVCGWWRDGERVLLTMRPAATRAISAAATPADPHSTRRAITCGRVAPAGSVSTGTVSPALGGVRSAVGSSKSSASESGSIPVNAGKTPKVPTNPRLMHACHTPDESGSAGRLGEAERDDATADEARARRSRRLRPERSP